MNEIKNSSYLPNGIFEQMKIMRIIIYCDLNNRYQQTMSSKYEFRISEIKNGQEDRFPIDSKEKSIISICFLHSIGKTSTENLRNQL